MVAQMVSAFGMNPKFGGSSPPQVAQLTFQMLTLLQKYQNNRDLIQGDPSLDTTTIPEGQNWPRRKIGPHS